nr:unnamed protein product [Callosobruchus chinensis]
MNNLRSRKVYSVRRDVDDRDWKVLYRFERENVEWMSEYFLGDSGERRGGALTPLQKLKIFLRYVADPGFQTGVATDIGVRQPTVSNVIAEVIQKIIQKSDYWIHFPSTDEEFEREKVAWQQAYNFPCAIGAIDCTHIPILKPAAHGDEYINRKGFPSLNVLASCNSSEVFTSVDISWPGSVHDARIWTNSTIQPVISRNQVRALLLGESGFGIAPWLMTPFRTPNNPQQQAFNNLLTRERVIIERCFGQVKQRFPILQYKIRLATEKVPHIIACCFILHNVAKYLKDSDFPAEENHEEDFDGAQIEDENIRVRDRGNMRRTDIANIIYEMNR